MPEQSKSTAVALGDRVWELPPLILHPFSNQRGPGQLLEGSKAALMLAGLLPGEGEDRDELRRKLLLSRYSEVRMLYFVGKDLLRWVGQCVELVSRAEELGGLGIREQSFAALLVYRPPEAVLQKLRQWGVASPESVFSRALGIATLFRDVPPADLLTESFLLHYHSFADHVFVCSQNLTPFAEISPANFRFELYASGEYLKMLEKEWGGE
jgi:hypothetical protein